MRAIWTFVCVICICSLVLGDGNSPSYDTGEHGNNPRVVSETLDLMTYVYLLAPDLYAGYVATADSPLIECIEGALLLCGAGEVCWVCVVNHEICQIECRSEDGSCAPAPPCGPAPVPDVEG